MHLLHHVLQQLVYPRCLAVDLRNAVISAVDIGLLEVLGQKELLSADNLNQTPPLRKTDLQKQLTRQGAWILVNVL